LQYSAQSFTFALKVVVAISTPVKKTLYSQKLTNVNDTKKEKERKKMSIKIRAGSNRLRDSVTRIYTSGFHQTQMQTVTVLFYFKVISVTA
jgi:hypothetical protein